MGVVVDGGKFGAGAGRERTVAWPKEVWAVCWRIRGCPYHFGCMLSISGIVVEVVSGGKDEAFGVVE